MITMHNARPGEGMSHNAFHITMAQADMPYRVYVLRADLTWSFAAFRSGREAHAYQDAKNMEGEVVASFICA